MLPLALVADTAAAHPGGASGGLAHGLAHPIGGLDHLLAMLAVGAFAYALGGRARWLVPAAFVVMMAVGGALGMAALGLPLVEVGIALSLVALGGLVAMGQRLPLATAMALVGVFAVFHGQAHGTEMPADAAGLTYGLGFVAATSLLHAAGLGLAHALTWAPHATRLPLTRTAGGLVALAGVIALVPVA
jgi:urease accessory protein